jgi:hypothetical protein
MDKIEEGLQKNYIKAEKEVKVCPGCKTMIIVYNRLPTEVKI